MSEFHDILSELTTNPSGDAEEWLKRYEPLVDQIIRHREVPAPKVSAVVVAWNTGDLLVECVSSLREQVGLDDGELQITVVDNGGNESVRAQLESIVDVEVRMCGNVRPSRARNLGAALSRGDVIAFVDDDGVVECDYVRNALRYFDDPGLVGLRGRVIAKHHPLFTSLASHYSRGREPLEDCLITEGCAFVRRDAFLEVGGFRDEMFGHEGIELTYRLRSVGATMYVPNVVLRHDYMDSWTKFWRKSWRHSEVADRTHDQRDDLADFMDSYFARSFPKPQLSRGQSLARTGLAAARTLVKLGAKATARLQLGRS